MRELNSDNLVYLSKKYGTPLYTYNGNGIQDQYHKLLSYFNPRKINLFYAMKANYNPHILKILMDLGAGVDCVSISEILLAKRVGFANDKIIYTANMMSDNEIKSVADLGILLNIGSLSELKRYAQMYPRSSVCLRLNPDIVSGHHEKVRTGGKETKFGINLLDLSKAREIALAFNLKIVGLHEHTGSGIPETVDLQGGMENILKVVNNLDFPDLQFIDFGGGFKINYRPEEKELDYNSFAKQANVMLDQCFNSYGRELQVYFEPGRFLVAQAGILLVKVTTIKENGGRVIVGVNSGFGQLIRPMFYSAYHQIHNVSNMSGIKLIYDVAGNICETGDYFAKGREIQEIREKDILAILDAGAYCYSMGSVYNLRPMPAEVLVKNGEGKLIRKGLSEAQLVEQITNESNFY